MKALVVTILAAFSFSAFAADSKPVDPKMADMMKKWQEFATPGAPHKIFAEMAGNWTFTSKMWMQPNGAAAESKGTSTLKLLMGGRYLQNESKGEAMGQPFEGMGITGYDNLKKKYDTLWLDNMGTGMMHGEGSFDSAKKILTDSGKYTCPTSYPKECSYRGEWKLKDKNNMSYTMFGPGEDGKEFKQMEMLFTRAK